MKLIGINLKIFARYRRIQFLLTYKKLLSTFSNYFTVLLSYCTLSFLSLSLSIYLYFLIHFISLLSLTTLSIFSHYFSLYFLPYYFLRLLSFTI